ncbi:MAG: UDP-N-acetylmuramoyl-L-alanyl-D-glutamate--2,6-diaminopimelate ligase [Candidatus Nealsonbacteria bacterium]|nr:UDP-N-acetylmuramoyl-L-alanyl-D-glutamate--2,6-diaminopimelate ligase [Candidatus Nealsonbacteria bacterium]
MQVCPGLGRHVSLRTLLPGAEFVAAGNVEVTGDMEVTGCTCDSRRVRPGDLFVALPGVDCDGHDFIAEAAARGCSAVVAGRRLSDVALPVCVVSDPRDAFGRICQALAGNPSYAMKVVGITGTNGKTTTACLAAGVLAKAAHRVGLLGTVGYFDGEEAEESAWTTPPADVLADWLRRMQHNGCSHAVMEVSSHALDQARVAGVRFDAACLTNVTRDHLDYHATIGDYRAAKSKLFDSLPGEAFAVINADDPASTEYLRRLDGPVLTVGIHSAAEITATPIEQLINEQTFLLTAGTETVPVRTQMIGQHHVYNCLVAAAVGLTYGVDLPTIARGLEAAGHVPGRLERLECGQPFGVFVDYAHTPDALQGSLRTLREVTRGRLICVFGAGGDRDRQKRPLMARAVENGADLAVVTNDNPRTEDPEAIIRQTVAGFRNSIPVEIIPDRAEAIGYALSMAEPGDCVLIAGKGHETEQIIGDDHTAFDDCEVASQWLYEVQPYAEVSN